MNGNGPFLTSAALRRHTCFSTILLLLHGCTHQPTPTILTTDPAGQPSQSVLILEAKAEADDLRAALAEERIKAAKRAAKVRAAQNHAAALRNREIERLETISNLKNEVSTLKTERDKLRTKRDALREEVSRLRAKVAGIPQLLKMVTQIRTMETSINGIGTSIETLSRDLAQVKEEMKKRRTVAEQPTASDAPIAKEVESIVVKRGDSLWRLAQRYDTTVANLKALNNLDTDRIIIGQSLKIVASDLAFGTRDRVEVPTPDDALNH